VTELFSGSIFGHNSPTLYAVKLEMAWAAKMAVNGRFS